MEKLIAVLCFRFTLPKTIECSFAPQISMSDYLQFKLSTYLFQVQPF